MGRGKEKRRRERRKENQGTKKEIKREKREQKPSDNANPQGSPFLPSLLSFLLFPPAFLPPVFPFRGTIKNWSLSRLLRSMTILLLVLTVPVRRALYHGQSASHSAQTPCSLIGKTVTRCPARERKNQIFRLFWRRVSNHWINPQNVAQTTLRRPAALFCLRFVPPQLQEAALFHPPRRVRFKARLRYTGDNDRRSSHSPRDKLCFAAK